MRRLLFSLVFVFCWAMNYKVSAGEHLCRTLVLCGKEKSRCVLPPADQREGVVCVDLEVPGNLCAFIQQLEMQFIDEPINEQMLEELPKAIQRYYESMHHPFVTIGIPEQEISNGLIMIQVIESKISEVKVENEHYTRPGLLKNYLGAQKNETIDVKQMRKNLDFMNRNPFRKVDLIYSPGIERNTTDIELVVKDRKPLRVYAGTNNNGVENTQRGRFFAGIDTAVLFKLDQFLAYQYTAAYNPIEFQAHTLQYIAYLPWKQILNLFGGYSSIKSAKLVYPAKKNHGYSGQASIRYLMPFDPRSNLSQTFAIGFDFKRTNNTVEYTENFPVIAKNVNLSQFMAQYSGIYQTHSVRLEFEGEIIFSPGALLPDESDAAYQTLRPGAQNHWVYGRGMVSYHQKLSSWFNLMITARGQLSSQSLLPSEQIGLGGFDTVRGYDERQLNYDSGYILNGELRTRPFSFFREKSDALQFLGFVDYGYGGNHTLLPTEKKSDYLLGIGPGVRYTIDPWVTARLDLGFKLHNESGFTGGSAMWFFGFVVNY